MIEWALGKRDSTDGRWMIRTAHIRTGDRSEVEYELIDRHRARHGGGPDSVVACRSNPADARAAAEAIVAAERAWVADTLTRAAEPDGPS